LPTAEYAKDAQGIVHLSGGIKGGTSGTVAFVLPKGDRPRGEIFIPVISNDPNLDARVEIQTNGHVTPLDSTTVSNGGVNTFTALDGVSFPVG
jgi:hypothetical protein